MEGDEQVPEEEQRRELSRRQLVGGAAVAAAAFAVPGSAEAKKKSKSKGRSRTRKVKKVDVCVVGAGFAGLKAAYDLKKAGKSVVVMEARKRVGGRSYSKSLGVAGAKDVANLGATFVGPTQTAIIALAEEMGIGRFKTYNEGKNVLYFNGKRATYTGAVPPVDAAALIEAQKGIIQLNDMAKTVPLDAPWKAAKALEWDSQTVDTWKNQNVVSPNGRKLIDLAVQAVFSAESRDLSLLYLLFYIHSAGTLDELINTAGGAQEQRIDGGTQLIAQELARRIGSKRVMLNTAVRTIFKKGSRYEVATDSRRKVLAKRVIVAIPPTLAGRIRYSPKMPARRDQLTQRVPMGSVTKTFAVYPTAFWRDDGLTGQVTSDEGPVKVTFDGSPRSGKPGVMLGFVDGEDARELNGLPKAERIKREVESYVRYFGPKARNYTKAFDYPWDNDRIARGAPIGFFPPGVLTSFGPQIREPQGGIHWAGTETSLVWTGYMDGAVRSGERAAKEVLATL